MKVDINDLFDIVKILEERIKEVYKDKVIEIPEDDYYWNVPDESKYIPTEDPKELSLGQISFDWDELIKLKEEVQSEGRVPISYHLGLVAEIFNAIKKSSSGNW